MRKKASISEELSLITPYTAMLGILVKSCAGGRLRCGFFSRLREVFFEEGSWRMGWDSNPRDACTPGGFQDQCLQPLGHPSGKVRRDLLHRLGMGLNRTSFAFYDGLEQTWKHTGETHWRNKPHKARIGQKCLMPFNSPG